MPLGATPSRWCVCQFHHFRAQKLLYFSVTCWISRLVFRCGVSVYVTSFCTSRGTEAFRFTKPRARQQHMKRASLRVDVTHRRFHAIVARRVLNSDRGQHGEVSAMIRFRRVTAQTVRLSVPALHL